MSGAPVLGGRPCGSADELVTEARRLDELHDAVGQNFRPHHQTMNPVWVVGQAVLFLGGWRCANDWTLMEENNIKLVVNCTDSVQSHPDLGKKGGTSFIQFMVTRAHRARDVYAMFRDEVFEAVVDALAAGKSVLIHCRAGAHRAGTVTCALVMYMGHLSMDEAVRSVKRSRSVVSISGTFCLVLRDLEAALARERAKMEPLVAAPAAEHDVPLNPTEPVAAPAAEERPTAVIPIDLEPSSEEDVIGTVGPAPVAAPAAGEPAEPPPSRFQKGWVENPGAKLLMLSWNAGGGCRNMFDIINRSGYNLVILQEARVAWQRRFPDWATCIEHDQLFAARLPVPMKNTLT